MRVSPAIEWYRLGSRRPQPVAGMNVILSSGERWRGLRVDLADVTGPGELPEGTLKEHTFVAHVDGPARTDVWYEGKQSSGECAPGDVCILPARMSYAVRRYGPGRLTIISAGVPFMEAVAGDDLAGRLIDLQPIFCARDPLMTQLMTALTEEVLADNPAGPLYAETLGSALAAHVLRKYAAHPNKLKRGGLSSSALRSVTEHIEDRLADPISLQDLANIAGMSTHQLVRRFKESTGMPPHQYLLRRRVERARVLLRRKDLTILEVALACGFSGQSHFALIFRLHTGVTPRAFRRSL